MLDSLSEYKSKRDFKRTSEPAGKVTSRSTKKKILSFAVQEHHASHLHYDFRLEWNGVLKSWAVPKGPSLDPKDKRLAIEVEDHPLEYGLFEGKIPKGEYGAGQVYLWDHGEWYPQGDPQTDYKNGKLKFTLRGEKLQGAWSLVRMRSKQGTKKPQWLLIKEAEEMAHESSEIGSVNASPSRSVLEKEKKKQRILEPIGPQLAMLAEKVPEGNEWLLEVKYDGYRLLAIKQMNEVTLYTRNQLDWTTKFPKVAEALKSIPIKEFIIDGEVVVFNEAGISSFQLLQESLQNKTSSNMHYVVFDILQVGQTSLRAEILKRRRIKLDQFWKKVPTAAKKTLVLSEIFREDSLAFHKAACAAGLEGLIAKRTDAIYQTGRHNSWLKIKCSLNQEFVIGGYTKPKGNRAQFGSLLLGYYEGKSLIYCGRVGTGFTDSVLGSLLKKMSKLQISASPFQELWSVIPKLGVQWLKPELICQVGFSEWTRDKRLRHPVFLGLRSDKAAKEVQLDLPNDQDQEIEISNGERKVFPRQGYTKDDLADYYDGISTWILPYLNDRPLSLLRCPTGIDGACFFQKHYQGTVPKELGQIEVKERNSSGNYLLLHDAAGLRRLVQLNVIEFHPWASRAQSIEEPEYFVFDLDPGDAVGMKTLVAAAANIREELEALGLISFLKTSGGKGLHVVVPIKRHLIWTQAKAFTQAFSARLTRDFPKLYIANSNIEKRKGKIFVDYLRNGRGATSVAAYSARARDGATVSMPLAWEDLSSGLDPREFTIKTALSLIKQRSDPWQDFWKTQQSLSPEIQKILAA